MPSPPREFPVPEELYTDYTVSDSLEDWWPLLDQANQVVSENVDPWFLQQQQAAIFTPPLLLENNHQVNPVTVAAQENSGPPPCDSHSKKGKKKLDGEQLPSKWKKSGEKLKSLRISDNYDTLHLDHEELANPEGLLHEGTSPVSKKQNHNAKERVRRMKLNASYLSLGALLPPSRRSKKRWTAPSIIDKMVHYIPELKTEIEELNKKKEELETVSKSLIQYNTGDDQFGSTTVSVHEVSGREELIVQVCKEGMRDEEDNTLSYLLWNLEVEDFVLLGASTNNVGKDRVCYNLHVQMRVSCSSHGFSYTEGLKEKVLSWLRNYTPRTH